MYSGKMRKSDFKSSPIKQAARTFGITERHEVVLGFVCLFVFIFVFSSGLRAEFIIRHG